MSKKEKISKVLKAMDKAGIPYRFWPESEMRQSIASSWNGTNFNLTRARTPWDLLHEMSHWLVAPKEHRRLKNFGLGADPWYGNGISEERFTYKVRQKWEVVTCLVEFAIGFRWGWNVPKRARELNFHDYGGIKSMPEILRGAEEQERQEAYRFITKTGTPRVCIRHLIDL